MINYPGLGNLKMTGSREELGEWNETLDLSRDNEMPYYTKKFGEN